MQRHPSKSAPFQEIARPRSVFYQMNFTMGNQKQKENDWRIKLDACIAESDQIRTGYEGVCKRVNNNNLLALCWWFWCSSASIEMEASEMDMGAPSFGEHSFPKRKSNLPYFRSVESGGVSGRPKRYSWLAPRTRLTPGPWDRTSIYDYLKRL